MTDKLKNYLAEWEQKRDAATTLDGFEESNGMMTSDPDANLAYFLLGLPTDTANEDAEFIRFSGVESAKLVHICEVLIESIENYLEVQKFLAEPEEDTCVSSDDFRQALEQAIKILEGG